MTVSGSATNAPVPTPIIQVTPGSIGYGTILAGMSKTNSFTVKNNGTGTLSGSASVGSPFSIVLGSSYSLGAGQAQAVVVVFSPLVASNYNQSVTFSGGGGANVTVTGSATNAPVVPAVSPIRVDATDVDLALPGLQIYSGTTVQFSVTATNALTWQWSYSINGGAPVVYTNSTSPITNVSYYFNTNEVGDNYVWTLVGEQWPDVGGITDKSYGGSVAEFRWNGNGCGTRLYGDVGSGKWLVEGQYSGKWGYRHVYLSATAVDGCRRRRNCGLQFHRYQCRKLRDPGAGQCAQARMPDSYYVNIDSPPQQDATMIWDIIPITSGFEQRMVSWRGNGSENSDQFVPKIFNLARARIRLFLWGEDRVQPWQALPSYQWRRRRQTHPSHWQQ